MPPELLQSAMTLRSIATQTGQVIGPALGGLLYGVSPSLVYLLAAARASRPRRWSWRCTPRRRPTPPSLRDGRERRRRPRQGADLHSVLEGLRFVRHTPILLGAILLDLLAVLFGGAVALLPIFAKSILHVGATGLGVLRAAPAVGALLGAAVITRRPIAGRAGRLLLTVVFIYGACIVVFGLSRSYPLSLAALGVSGFVDLYSMNIRSTTVALASPDRLRGRVNAVEMVFISASNQLGLLRVGPGGGPGGDDPGGRRRRGDDDADRGQLGHGCSRRWPRWTGWRRSSPSRSRPPRSGRGRVGVRGGGYRARQRRATRRGSTARALACGFRSG